MAPQLAAFGSTPAGPGKERSDAPGAPEPPRAVSTTLLTRVPDMGREALEDKSQQACSSLPMPKPNLLFKYIIKSTFSSL